jgi:hypothetical protein
MKHKTRFQPLRGDVPSVLQGLVILLASPAVIAQPAQLAHPPLTAPSSSDWVVAQHVGFVIEPFQDVSIAVKFAPMGVAVSSDQRQRLHAFASGLRESGHDCTLDNFVVAGLRTGTESSLELTQADDLFERRAGYLRGVFAIDGVFGGVSLNPSHMRPSPDGDANEVEITARQWIQDGSATQSRAGCQMRSASHAVKVIE